MASGRCPGARGRAVRGESVDPPAGGRRVRPGPLASPGGETLPVPLRIRARRVVLRTRRDRSVFYHGGGSAAAASLVKKDSSYRRIDDLLSETPEGRELLTALKSSPWARTRSAWWELSRRLARESSGDVHVFGDGRYSAEPRAGGSPGLPAGKTGSWQSPFAREHYADSVFEKVELPELETNPEIDTIFYNGRDIDEFEEPLRRRRSSG